jgi:hypothetical protein
MSETPKSWISQGLASSENSLKFFVIGLVLLSSMASRASSQSDSKDNQDLIDFYNAGDSDDDPGKGPDSPKQESVKPLGEIKGPTPPECHPRNLENNLINRDFTAKDFTERVNSYFAKCEKYWNGPAKSGKFAMLEFIFTEYDITKNKGIHNTTLSMRDGSKIQAYVAMQNGFTKRPWVIAKCGVFCTASDSTAVRNYLINLFDQSPFNVIFLSNRTGVDYIKNNEKLTLGGYLEAHDYYEVGRWLKEDSPYKDTVDSLHVLGMSLAGSAAAYVEPLADAYGYDENNRLFQSVMSICPVINLEPTIKDMYTSKAKRYLFSKLTWDELQEVRPALHEVDNLLNRKSRPDYNEFPDLMGTIVSHYAAQWGKSPFTYRSTREIQTKEDLWELNQFSNLRKEIKAPLLVWASKDDSIVSNEINTASIPSSWVYQNSDNLGVLNVNYGNHCALVTSYGYPVSSALMRSFVLSHSKEYLDKRTLKTTKIDFDFMTLGLEKHLRQWWEAFPNVNYVTINFETHSNLRGPFCALTNIYSKKAENCRNHKKIKVPLKVLNALNIQPPTNSTEAEMLSRKLNGLVRVTSGGHPLEGTSLPPSQIEWFD